MVFTEISNEQRRQIVDLNHLADKFYGLQQTYRHSYSGSMRWVTRNGKEYLHKKIHTTEKSLGAKSADTEKVYSSFKEGKADIRSQIRVIQDRMQKMAPVNRALNIGRVPGVTSKVLRALQEHGLLGTQILVIGTNALFAYESKAGIQFSSELLATGDTDLLWDSRMQLKLAANKRREVNLMKILKNIDRSFEKRNRLDYRAYNAEGFAIDLITPEDDRFVFSGSGNASPSGDISDLHSAPVFGLHWLINSKRLRVTTIGEDGLPTPMVTVDPQPFALYKMWMATRMDRDPIKKHRDLAQGKAVKEVAEKYLGAEFDPKLLMALPSSIREP